MKVFITILLIIAAISVAVCLLRVSLRVTYIDSLKVDIRVDPFSINRLITEKRKKKKHVKQADDGTGDGENKSEKKKHSIASVLDDVMFVLREFISRFAGHVTVHLAYIDICVGGEDPARTAVTYGKVVQSVAYITELLRRNTHLKPKRDAHLRVDADLVSGKSRMRLDITLSVTIGGILTSLLGTAWAYIVKNIKSE